MNNIESVNYSMNDSKKTLTLGTKLKLSGQTSLDAKVQQRKKRNFQRDEKGQLISQHTPVNNVVDATVPADTTTSPTSHLSKAEQLARELAVKNSSKLQEEMQLERERVHALELKERERQEQLKQIERQNIEKQQENIISEPSPIIKNTAVKTIADVAEVSHKKTSSSKTSHLSLNDEEMQHEKRKSHHNKNSKNEGGRRQTKISLTRVLDEEDERHRSIASIKRARAKEKQKAQQIDSNERVVREVVLPETITVGDLANRMSERLALVIKTLMQMGMIATQHQVIDADTAQLIIEELGHKVKRVADSDVENVIDDEEDNEHDLVARPPIVTVMGHVDHGKTSLLDALRFTDVVAGEAGGITQHIGAYQTTLPDGRLITFLDTPGHEAFTAMRARGSKITDIIILVVAADDGVRPQTIEAINHAKVAHVPIVVAINKCDKPDANPDKTRTELLNHDIVVEQLGGDIQSVNISAKQKHNLDVLLEAVLLQAEMLDLRANPNRQAKGVIIEARQEKGRGNVATVLIQKGNVANR